MENILIVEDDIIINGGVKLYLEKQGYKVVSVYSVQEAKEIFSPLFDLIILDINLPDGDGYDLCMWFRSYREVPVLFLTAKDTEEDMIKGFEIGCDDYIAKPFSIGLLGQRVKAVLRRSKTILDNNQMFVYKDLSVQMQKQQVMIRGEYVKLSPTEFKLLSVLIENRGQVMTRVALLEKVWDVDENYIDENTLSVHIKRLRSKLEENPKKPIYIITVFGIGYTFGE